jgi:hypothetical protein
VIARQPGFPAPVGREGKAASGIGVRSWRWRGSGGRKQAWRQWTGSPATGERLLGGPRSGGLRSRGVSDRAPRDTLAAAVAWWHVWRLAAIRSSMQGPPDLRRPTHRLDQPARRQCPFSSRFRRHAAIPRSTCSVFPGRTGSTAREVSLLVTRARHRTSSRRLGRGTASYRTPTRLLPACSHRGRAAGGSCTCRDEG